MHHNFNVQLNTALLPSFTNYRTNSVWLSTKTAVLKLKPLTYDVKPNRHFRCDPAPWRTSLTRVLHKKTTSGQNCLKCAFAAFLVRAERRLFKNLELGETEQNWVSKERRLSVIASFRNLDFGRSEETTSIEIAGLKFLKDCTAGNIRIILNHYCLMSERVKGLTCRIDPLHPSLA